MPARSTTSGAERGAPCRRPTSRSSTAARSSSAEVTALADAGGQHVREVLDQLSEEQRAVITLRVLGDLTLEQTADVVGKSVGAVKQLQRRGLLELRALVERGEVAL